MHYQVFNFAKALFDLGTSINLMPMRIYKQLELRSPKFILMKLLLVDRTVKKLMRILCDILLRVASFIFQANFVILESEFDFEVSLFWGGLFL